MSIETTPPGVPQPKNNGLAVASLVLGILAVLLCGVGAVLGIPGLICGIMGMSRVKKSGGAEKGHGLALTGTILSGVSIAMIPVVGLLAAIAIPNFVKARETAQRNVCISNLRQIEMAKEMWATEHKSADGDVSANEANLTAGGKYLPKRPVCPAGGTYSYNPIGTRPTCSVPRHDF